MSGYPARAIATAAPTIDDMTNQRCRACGRTLAVSVDLPPPLPVVRPALSGDRSTPGGASRTSSCHRMRRLRSASPWEDAMTLAPHLVEALPLLRAPQSWPLPLVAGICMAALAGLDFAGALAAKVLGPTTRESAGCCWGSAASSCCSTCTRAVCSTPAGATVTLGWDRAAPGGAGAP